MKGNKIAFSTERVDGEIMMCDVEVGDKSFARANLDAVHHDKRRHFPLRLLPAQHSEL